MKKSIITRYYDNKSVEYGMSGLRQRHLLSIIGLLKNKTVLDVGCSTGYFGKILKAANNYVVGIDISKSAIKIAKKNLDEAYCVNIENELLPTKRKFDLIILSEVIEHLFDPESTLKKVIRHLKKNGLIIITTPNISFLPNRISILFGKFEYQEQGMFDVGHIHFFNYYTLLNLLKKCDLKLTRENHIAFPLTLNFLVKYIPNISAYQFIIAAKKSSSWPKIKP